MSEAELMQRCNASQGRWGDEGEKKPECSLRGDAANFVPGAARHLAPNEPAGVELALECPALHRHLVPLLAASAGHPACLIFLNRLSFHTYKCFYEIMPK